MESMKNPKSYERTPQADEPGPVLIGVILQDFMKRLEAALREGGEALELFWRKIDDLCAQRARRRALEDANPSPSDRRPEELN
jgi:hypothetical protein